MNPEVNNEYSVNWKNHMNHIRKAFDHLLNSNELTDVTLCCEGRKIGAHKMLLSACSAYFRDTFKEVPSQHPVVILYGVEFSVLLDILHFIYNGEVSVETSKLDMFLKTAHMLQVSGLTEDTNEKTAIGTQEKAIESTSYQNTKETCVQTATLSTPSDEAKKGLKRARTKEVEAPKDKLKKQEKDPLLLSDIKCEPTELVNFEDLLQDPLQPDPPEDTPELFVPSQSSDEMDFSSTQEMAEVSRINLFSLSQNMQDEGEVPREGEESSGNTKESILPKKSRELYEAEYNAYREWCQKMNITLTTEDSVLGYFSSNLLARYKSSTLWSKYSMLRSTINLKENVDISKFPAVISFLKRKAKGYKPKKSLTFTRENIDLFLTRADDELHLLNKVILIIGIAGACRRQELVSLLASNVQDCHTHFLVKLIDAETKRDRTFIILPGQFGSIDLLHVIRTYTALRSPKTSHDRFFVNCLRGKCTVQPVGINKIASVPSTVAKFLNLENYTLYTGHCFRRTSTALLGNARRCSY